MDLRGSDMDWKVVHVWSESHGVQIIAVPWCFEEQFEKAS